MRSFVKNLLFTASLFVGTASALAQGTAFTYQGRVTEGGVPASGQWDIVFSLHDAASGGNQLGLALTNPAVSVSLGLFTVTLDLGAQFPGAERWLEMAVRTNGSGAFVTLSPRQPITPTPYAITAGRVSGPISITQLPATLVTNGATGVNLSGTFTGSGAGLSNLPAVGLPAGVTLVSADPQDAALLGAGLQRFMTVPAPAWVGGTTVNAPLARSEHTAIWTAHEWLVWGGNVGSGVTVGTGAGYSADADQWSAISTIGAPSARKRHSAVWTGSEMIIWGGSGSGAYVGTGARYNPTNLQWTPVTTLNAPAGRSEHVAVWTGARLVVWGGRDGGGLFDTGAVYNPASDAWTTLAVPSAPDARQNAAAVWAGDRLLLWGGTGDSGELATGAHLLFEGATNATQWLPISTVNAPSARTGHSAVWTGSRLLVWGGRNAGTPLGDGGSYDPATDSWQFIPAATNSLFARSGHVAVWTGTEMLIWSGETLGGASATGSAYNPATGQWRALTAAGGAVARTDSTAAWTGTELLVFGGRNGSSLVGSLQRLNPQPAWHFFRKL